MEKYPISRAGFDALIKELKYLKEDGIIKIDGRKITLMQKKEPF